MPKIQKVTIKDQPFALIPLIPGVITTIQVEEKDGELKTSIRSKDAVPDAIKDYGAFKIDWKQKTVIIGQQHFRLTSQLFSLFCLFAEHPKETQTYEALAEAGGIKKDNAYISGAIHRLKACLKGRIDGWLKNAWGIGYTFDPS